MSTSTLSFFFFNDTATTEIYTLSLHDALPISGGGLCPAARHAAHGRSDVDAPAAYPAHVPGQRQVGRRSDAAGVVGGAAAAGLEHVLGDQVRSEEHPSELQSQSNLVCRLLLEK